MDVASTMNQGLESAYRKSFEIKVVTSLSLRKKTKEIALSKLFLTHTNVKKATK